MRRKCATDEKYDRVLQYFFRLFRLFFSLTGFNLMTHNSAGGDDATRPRNQGKCFPMFWIAAVALRKNPGLRTEAHS
jgi:hypothetical protein